MPGVSAPGPAESQRGRRAETRRSRTPDARPAAAMYDPERGWSLSFAGCGFLGIYHIGVTSCLSERAPHLLREARTFFGASAGALHCAFLLSGIPMEQTLQALVDLVRSARSRNIGVLHPTFSLNKEVRDGLQKHLPDNVHQLVSGKIVISLTRVADGENVLVSDFRSKDEVVDALSCSSFVPFFSGLIPPSFRGVRYVDGAVSNIIPFFDTKTTITVSPFYGESDICPKVKSTNFLHVNVTKLSVRLCSENLYLLTRVLFPSDLKVLGELCCQGYLDTVRFLEENGICDRPPLCLSASPAESEVLEAPREHGSLQSSPSMAAGEAKPEEATLLDHPHLSILPWEDSTLETLSPRLTIALREAIGNQDGYINKMCNFLPIKVMSYLVLPCTLPVESAIAVVQRLVMWLPDMPSDIQWLWWTTSRICSRVMTRLLPVEPCIKDTGQKLLN
ncbi:1-acylglycerol-3-phosphate O-acyltransferase PNPLA3 isoform X1 [Orcinus orca]|uniref:1-acylglycerol-3-phosphate O-acyltransferase PNPLA3 isoform X1 n=1 Tax=Orcinus orca TaxID=9733 RepID=UPI002111C83B|nr:1-acylglycerol-3-phosphate O-acyltransferase PNPLA3 isoform X1 [Orcinus orca]